MNKRIIAAVIAFILCFSASCALAVNPQQCRDRFMAYQQASGGNGWEWSYDSAKRLHLGTNKKSSAAVGIYTDENGELSGIYFTCEKKLIAMNNDGSFSSALTCYSDLIMTCMDLFPRLGETEFMWDFDAYDISYLTGEDGNFHLKSYGIGFICYSEFSVKDGFEYFLFNLSVV